MIKDNDDEYTIVVSSCCLLLLVLDCGSLCSSPHLFSFVGVVRSCHFLMLCVVFGCYLLLFVGVVRCSLWFRAVNPDRMEAFNERFENPLPDVPVCNHVIQDLHVI